MRLRAQQLGRVVVVRDDEVGHSARAMTRRRAKGRRAERRAVVAAHHQRPGGAGIVLPRAGGRGSRRGRVYRRRRYQNGLRGRVPMLLRVHVRRIRQLSRPVRRWRHAPRAHVTRLQPLLPPLRHLGHQVVRPQGGVVQDGQAQLPVRRPHGRQRLPGERGGGAGRRVPPLVVARDVDGEVDGTPSRSAAAAPAPPRRPSSRVVGGHHPRQAVPRDAPPVAPVREQQAPQLVAGQHPRQAVQGAQQHHDAFADLPQRGHGRGAAGGEVTRRVDARGRGGGGGGRVVEAPPFQQLALRLRRALASRRAGPRLARRVRGAVRRRSAVPGVVLVVNVQPQGRVRRRLPLPDKGAHGGHLVHLEVEATACGAAAVAAGVGAAVVVPGTSSLGASRPAVGASGVGRVVGAPSPHGDLARLGDGLVHHLIALGARSSGGEGGGGGVQRRMLHRVGSAKVVAALRHGIVGNVLLPWRQIILVTAWTRLLLRASVAIRRRGANVRMWQALLHRHLVRMLLLLLTERVLMMQRAVIHA